jgi:ABC-type microcin C transport system permease subunit YejE
LFSFIPIIVGVCFGTLSLYSGTVDAFLSALFKLYSDIIQLFVCSFSKREMCVEKWIYEYIKILESAASLAGSGARGEAISAWPSPFL